jgi:prepilin-type N-terminal cleavage/methylation domain-containing protein
MARSQTASQRGFTLMEVMVAMPLALLLLVGAFSLFLGATQMASKTSAQITTAQDAANSVQHVIELVREAQWFCLPGDSAVETNANGTNGGSLALGFVPQTGASANGYETTLASGETIYTGVEITVPTYLQPTDVGYTGSSYSAITVLNKSGSDIALNSTTLPYNRDAYPIGMTVLLIYRGDSNMTPDPTAGGYLWEGDIAANGTLTNAWAMCKTVATGAQDAVQFVRPYENGEALPYQMEVKITSGTYSAINNQQTDEEGNGTYTSQLVGKCVLMRDHATTVGSSPALNSAHPVNNPFPIY